MRRRSSGLVWYFIVLGVLAIFSGTIMWNVWGECMSKNSFWFCAVALSR